MKDTINKTISQALPADTNYNNHFHAGFAIYGIPVGLWFLMPSSPIHIILGKLLLVVSRCPVALFWQLHYLVYCLIYAGYPTISQEDVAMGNYIVYMSCIWATWWENELKNAEGPILCFLCINHTDYCILYYKTTIEIMSFSVETLLCSDIIQTLVIWYSDKNDLVFIVLTPLKIS